MAMNYYRKFEKAVHKISRSFMYLAAASLFLMMVLTTCDVVGRYNRAYVIEGGTITLEGNAQKLAKDEGVIKAYLGG